MTLPDHPDGIYNPAAFGYARVSQAESEDGGLETQRQLLNEQGIRDDRIFTDVASGRHMARPGWKRLRTVVRPGDTIIATRLDCVARSLGLHAALRGPGDSPGEASMPSSRLRKNSAVYPGPKTVRR